MILLLLLLVLLVVLLLLLCCVLLVLCAFADVRNDHQDLRALYPDAYSSFKGTLKRHQDYGVHRAAQVCHTTA